MVKETYATEACVRVPPVPTVYAASSATASSGLGVSEPLNVSAASFACHRRKLALNSVFFQKLLYEPLATFKNLASFGVPRTSAAPPPPPWPQSQRA